MWEQVKGVMVKSSREMCGSVRLEGKNSKGVWWNDEVKAVVRRNEAVWKEVLAASMEKEKERCMKSYKEEKRKVYISEQKKVNE